MADQSNAVSTSAPSAPTSNIVKEGWLFKRGNSSTKHDEIVLTLMLFRGTH